MVYPLPKSSLNPRSNSSHTNPPYVTSLFPTFTANVTPSRSVPLQSIGTVLITQAKSAELVGFFLGGLVGLVVNSVSWHVIGYLCLAYVCNIAIYPVETLKVSAE